MKTRAVSMVLLMIASALAGCTSGDPDGDGELGIDTDVLNQMIEDNLQDFINNSSVTVHQTIHYHNNTTYVVDDGDYSTINNAHFNNTTNVDGGEINNYDQSETTYNIGGASFGEGVNGSVSGGSMMFVAHLEFTAMDLFPNYQPPANPQINNFSYTYTYYDYLTNDYRTDTFFFSCNVFYVVGSQSNNSTNQVSYWEDNSHYYNAWEQMYNSTIADMLHDAGQDQNIQLLCNNQFTGVLPIVDGTSGYQHTFLTIDIPEGYAIQYVQLDSYHSWFGCWDYYLSYYRCTDASYHSEYGLQNFYSYSEGPYPHHSNYYGGWDNLTIDFDLILRTYGETNGYSEPYSYSEYGEGTGIYSVWPTSEYVFTLYYRFVPVIPVE